MSKKQIVFGVTTAIAGAVLLSHQAKTEYNTYSLRKKFDPENVLTQVRILPDLFYYQCFIRIYRPKGDIISPKPKLAKKESLEKKEEKEEDKKSPETELKNSTSSKNEKSETSQDKTNPEQDSDDDVSDNTDSDEEINKQSNLTKLGNAAIGRFSLLLRNTMDTSKAETITDFPGELSDCLLQNIDKVLHNIFEEQVQQQKKWDDEIKKKIVNNTNDTNNNDNNNNNNNSNNNTNNVNDNDTKLTPNKEFHKKCLKRIRKIEKLKQSAFGIFEEKSKRWEYVCVYVHYDSLIMRLSKKLWITLPLEKLTFSSVQIPNAFEGLIPTAQRYFTICDSYGNELLCHYLKHTEFEESLPTRIKIPSTYVESCPLSYLKTYCLKDCSSTYRAKRHREVKSFCNPGCLGHAQAFQASLHKLLKKYGKTQPKKPIEMASAFSVSKAGDHVIHNEKDNTQDTSIHTEVDNKLQTQVWEI
ncbi:hypothetical protein RFI_27171 [Reticulomyxa filosa]|uniref:Uncharacterized protein n=1 Tax=Reticulomyxa filosa TaxID=46433 RepID=X6M976_RETFI|nr:hypothetical protein RFI_27171 [Reticulomyxa filosa]|eukprot:ETO10206.1 hypothetical protein RFI_27171 [Reticulomyxa filosa]